MLICLHSGFESLVQKPRIFRSFPHYPSVNSSCAHSPPGQPRDICAPCQFRGGISKFGTARGSGICLPQSYPRVLTHSWFLTRNPNMEDFIAKDQQFVADWIDRHGLDKLVEAFSILWISALLIKAQLELSLYIVRLRTINVNRRMHASLIKDLNKI